MVNYDFNGAIVTLIVIVTLMLFAAQWIIRQREED